MQFINEPYDWKTQSLAEFLNSGNIPSGWTEFFDQYNIRQKLTGISDNLDQNRENTIFYPPIHQVFRAFYFTPLDKIKAVVIGMDPYHNGSSIGLCFSVKPGNNINPSLRSIYKELRLEGFQPIQNGDLTHWAKQGVLMLNMSLTVEKSNAGSHSKFWYSFSEEVVRYIDQKRGKNVQWILMGNDACGVKQCIEKGIVHTTVHPMPLAAGKSSSKAGAFWGSGVFAKVKGIKW